MKLKCKNEKIRIFSLLMVRLCAILVVAVAWTGCEDPPPPPALPGSWGPCECGTDMFTLSFVNDPGRFTVDPDRSAKGWLYERGELVHITYNLIENERFLHWWVTPPSHLSSFSDSPSISVFMTANVSVWAVTDDVMKTISVISSDKNMGTVSINPPGGSYEYGTKVTITASANEGFRFKRWGSSGSADVNYGYRYDSSTTVEAVTDLQYTAEWESTTTPPSYPSYSGTVTLHGPGTADVYSAADIGSLGPAPYSDPVCSTYGYFSASCKPHSGFEFVYWRWVALIDGVPRHLCSVPSTLPGSSYVLPDRYLPGLSSAGQQTDFEAHLTKVVTLDIDVTGQGVVTSSDFRAYWNPQLHQVGDFYSSEPPSLVDSNKVRLTAEPCPGWKFEYWLIKDANKQWMPVTVPHPTTGVPVNVTGPINVYMNWWQPVPNGGPTDPENLRHVPPGEETHFVLAVFSELPSEILELKFTSDHGGLYDGNDKYGIAGNIITKPDWAKNTAKTPYIVHTMDSYVTADITIQLPCTGRPFQITGYSAIGNLDFYGEGFGYDDLLVVSVTSVNSLPAYIDRIEEPNIDWYCTFTDTGDVISLGETPKTVVYVTYGPNTSIFTSADRDFQGTKDDHYKPRIKLMDLLCNTANKEWVRTTVALNICNLIAGMQNDFQNPFDKHGYKQDFPFWEMLDDGLFECEFARLMGVAAMMHLGVPIEELQWPYEQGTSSFPSTDREWGYIPDVPMLEYYSSCTEEETMLVEIAPGNKVTYTLWLSDNGPVESFFKIKDNETDNWYYFAAAPASGIILGSEYQYDEYDKYGRYHIMAGTLGNGFSQIWLDRNTGDIIEADPLPTSRPPLP